MRGQAFETFKLAIAAIIAVTVLIILMSIIGSIGTVAGDPQSKMKELLKKAQGAGGGSYPAQNVAFTPMIIPASALAEAIGVLPTNIHFYVQTERLTEDVVEITGTDENPQLWIKKSFTGHIVVTSTLEGEYWICIGTGNLAELMSECAEEAGAA